MSIRCAHCGHDAPDGSPFCAICSAPLTNQVDQALSPTVLPPSGFSITAATMSAGQFSPPFAVEVGVGTMQTGYIFGSRYRIDRLLGSGGMGAVYQAWIKNCAWQSPSR